MHLNSKTIPVVALCGAAAFLLWKFHPAESGLFPECPIHKYSGFYCSGCGSLRSIHYLLQGNITAAWNMNPLTVLLIPGIAFLATAELFFHQYQWANRIKPLYLWLLIAVFIGFGILRNIPACSALVPH
jgi:hypothetical protein